MYRNERSHATGTSNPNLCLGTACRDVSNREDFRVFVEAERSAHSPTTVTGRRGKYGTIESLGTRAHGDRRSDGKSDSVLVSVSPWKSICRPRGPPSAPA